MVPFRERAVAGPLLNAAFLDSTRGRVLSALRRGPCAVDDLATSLSLSRNAVRAHLATLERDGLARAVGVRRRGGAGKPATLYGVAEAAEAQLSRAYAPVLRAVLDELRERAPAALTAASMRRVGRRLATALGVPRGAGGAAGARAARDLLLDLGADVRLDAHGAVTELKGCGACPVSEAVTAHPGVCHAVEALLTEAAGAPVHAHCEHGANPRCRFEVARGA